MSTLNVSITLSGAKEAIDATRVAVIAGAEQALEVAALRGEQLVKRNITSPYLGRPPAVATGTLANSIAYEISKEATISKALVFAQPPADVYADPVETGTMPHFPPPAALMLWVKRKFSVEDEKQAMSISFAIARKIAARGTSGFGMFARAMQTLTPELEGMFESAIAGSIERAGLAAA